MATSLQLLCTSAMGQPVSTTPSASGSLPVPAPSARLPATVTTRHRLVLPYGTLSFTATAGSIAIRDQHGTVLADIAYVAYQRDNADPYHRPVTFAFNGGPGVASAWLQVGAVGPWRVALTAAEADQPSAVPALVANAETWLDFTDLVFIDPAGAGYSQIRGDNPLARRTLWWVNGDTWSLGSVLQQWLRQNQREFSPRYLLGESYGGYRAVRMAQMLQHGWGIPISAMVLISPWLGVGSQGWGFDPIYWAARLPTEVAIARARHGPVTRDQLADVEDYTATDYITDLMHGPRDSAAVERMSTRVAVLTGLDPSVVWRQQGRLPNAAVLRDPIDPNGPVGSPYDGTLGAPESTAARADGFRDPVVGDMQTRVMAAMLAIYDQQLNWHPTVSYHLLNEDANKQWSYDSGMVRPDGVAFLVDALSRDSNLRVLVTHGLFDLVTPYFQTELALKQLPEIGEPGRVRLKVYPGGHTFYSNDASRAALHDDARALLGREEASTAVR
jgi:carboxypeptidase C (cathepsin A)